MNLPSFARPEWSPPVALALTLLGVLVMLAAARGASRARRLLGRSSRESIRRAFRIDAQLVAAALALGLALLGPRLGTRIERVLAHGVDLAIVIDASRSMDALDVPPSRLARARQIAADVLPRLAPGDRVALVAFGDRGIVLAPPTPDLDAIAELLPAVDESLLGRRESSLAAGLHAALDAISDAGERPRVVLLLADGEDPARGARDDAALAGALRGAGVRLVAVGLGTHVGAAVPDGELPLRDDSGRPITTRADLARLDALASASGGRLLAVDRFGGIDQGVLIAELRRGAGDVPGQWIERQVSADRTTVFAGIAFALLAQGLAPRFIAWPRRRARALLACLVALAAPRALAEETAPPDAALVREIAGLEAFLRARPGDDRALLALGIARARAAQHAAAAGALTGAALGARDAQRAALAFFDLGVVQISRGDLGAARDAFFESLARTPDDAAARANLEWTLGALRARESEAAPAPGGRAQTPGTHTPPERADESHGAAPENGSLQRDGTSQPPADERDSAEPAPQPDAAASERRAMQPSTLLPAEARRLLQSVNDSPGTSFRRAAREGERGARSRSPVW